MPLLAPSLLSAISLIYWFGNQGVLKGALQALGIDADLRRAGHRAGRVFRRLPARADDPGHRARRRRRAGCTKPPTRWAPAARRKFFTITLPGAKYGLISAALVSFTLVITDFGIPKVIGGNFNMLATDVFKLVIGQQDFQRGAVVALLLLAPAVLTFAVDRWVARRQTAMLTARAVPYRPAPRRWRDGLATAYCVADRRADAGDDGHGGVRIVRQLLALQPGAHAGPLHDGPVRRRGRRRPSSTA